MSLLNRDFSIKKIEIPKKVFKDLKECGFSVNESFVPKSFAQELLSELKHFYQKGLMHQANIGLNKNKHIDKNIRGDKIYWLDGKSEIQKRYFNFLQNYIDKLNREFFLGINNFEAHYAVYEEGSFYKKHFDNFKGKNNRVVTILFYLNENWQENDGGELVIYKDKEYLVLPKFATMATFITEEILHEVKVTNKKRYSLVAWLRRD
jgi:SM-20-related protein